MNLSGMSFFFIFLLWRILEKNLEVKSRPLTSFSSNIKVFNKPFEALFIYLFIYTQESIVKNIF